MKDLDLIKNDEYLKELITRSKLPDFYLEDNYNAFLRVCNSRALCRGCNGLEECRQPSKGERLALDYDGVLIEEIEYCRYGQVAKDKQDLLSRYVYCDVAANLAGLDLENVKYTDDQKQLYLLLAALYHGKREKGLYITGDLGVGKTYLCTAMANSLVKAGKKVAFVKVSNFFNEMRSAIGTSPELIDKNINILKKAEYLFLDDIGAESVSEFIRDDILFRILDYRLENSLITIFTSNLNKSDLLKHYQYDRKEKANLMNAKRLLERIDILSDDYVLTGNNLRRK
ncbi:MAG: ATP-binding protein [Erysipelotrichaceae bacterium]|nr:ATP-binding protein [Erysipelotrichaceae bacterium]MBP5279919.1 ATP-binding protein [Erysipelotrichaceae bacterium]